MQVLEITQEYVQLKCPVCEMRDTRLRWPELVTWPGCL